MASIFNNINYGFFTHLIYGSNNIFSNYICSSNNNYEQSNDLLISLRCWHILRKKKWALKAWHSLLLYIVTKLTIFLFTVLITVHQSSAHNNYLGWAFAWNVLGNLGYRHERIFNCNNNNKNNNSVKCITLRTPYNETIL